MSNSIYSSYPDRTITAAWESQVKEADKTPWLADTLTECGDEVRKGRSKCRMTCDCRRMPMKCYPERNTGNAARSRCFRIVGALLLFAAHCVDAGAGRSIECRWAKNGV